VVACLDATATTHLVGSHGTAALPRCAGAIDVEELQYALQVMGITKSAAEVLELMESVDQDGSGALARRAAHQEHACTAPCQGAAQCAAHAHAHPHQGGCASPPCPRKLALCCSTRTGELEFPEFVLILKKMGVGDGQQQASWQPLGADAGWVLQVADGAVLGAAAVAQQLVRDERSSKTLADCFSAATRCGEGVFVCCAPILASLKHVRRRRRVCWWRWKTAAC
jgi:hypothetical protein